MRILLLGANGQLGRCFIKQGGLSERGELFAASRDGQLTEGGDGYVADLSDTSSLRAVLHQLHPDVVINTAAYTAVDRAEEEENLALRINGEAVAELGQWARVHNALVVHYSTDYVFNGEARTPYGVGAQTDPLGAYGRSKLAGELALAASGAAHFNFRTAWVYAAHGQNFLRTMLRLGAERDELSVVVDQIGAPTSTNLIVAGTLAALDRWLHASVETRSALEGTHHLVASGKTSWHGFAEAVFAGAVDRGLLSKRPLVRAIGTSDFPTRARRPAYSVLDNQGFHSHFGIPLPDWKIGLEQVLDTMTLPSSTEKSC
ncbi:dTDP-4-dehydrorhamnose reductase [Dyella japonica]|uniref:dTDP-4-dehydrorhamnose reductase n=1 Tax=Dyella japonica A8 TaxID=1217721 RepID=A0A075K5F6_9GAMM|nr:dTDP-4-dehydrorhamnose reductase [Dyella japonica]AIF49389.1 dTDP-4-dehydrorhamnose reductase [Dyella japonica A8]